jgi:NAD(P)-dependent dehydrogenase (short-subunit alcohol dehydrogenase family)
MSATPFDLLHSRLALTGKTALVTGASRGLGAAIARQLDALGARVALSARDDTALKAVADTLGNGPVTLAAGLYTAARTEPATSTCSSANAGAILGSSASDQVDEATIDELHAVNFRAPFRLAGLAAADMAFLTANAAPARGLQPSRPARPGRPAARGRGPGRLPGQPCRRVHHGKDIAIDGGWTLSRMSRA